MLVNDNSKFSCPVDRADDLRSALSLGATASVCSAAGYSYMGDCFNIRQCYAYDTPAVPPAAAQCLSQCHPGSSILQLPDSAISPSGPSVYPSSSAPKLKGPSWGMGAFSTATPHA